MFSCVLRGWMFGVVLLVGTALVCPAGVCEGASEDGVPDPASERPREALSSPTTRVSKQPAEKEKQEEAEGSREVRSTLEEVKEELKEKEYGLDIHGAVVSFYQGAVGERIGKRKITEDAEPGVVGDLKLSYRPRSTFFKDGQFFLRFHAGTGKGSDERLGSKLLANLNTIADDSGPYHHDDGFDRILLEGYYAHEFCNEKLILAVGKTEPLVFIDTNAFANDQYSQFVGKPFVNNPILSNEDEYGPIFAASFTPLEGVTLTALVQSSTHPYALPSGQKDMYHNLLEDPFVAAQVAYSPKIFGQEGNYRLYYWNATYDHPRIGSRGSVQGWGLGLSLDQKITDAVGLFGRFGYHNEDAYEVPWFWSAGVNWKGILPLRAEDQLGIGLAGLKANEDLRHTGTEVHAELYYRIHLTKYFAVTPDFQWVVDPRGNSGNDPIFAGMVRGEFLF